MKQEFLFTNRIQNVFTCCWGCIDNPAQADKKPHGCTVDRMKPRAIHKHIGLPWQQETIVILNVLSNWGAPFWCWHILRLITIQQSLFRHQPLENKNKSVIIQHAKEVIELKTTTYNLRTNSTSKQQQNKWYPIRPAVVSSTIEPPCHKNIIILDPSLNLCYLPASSPPRSPFSRRCCLKLEPMFTQVMDIDIFHWACPQRKMLWRLR